MAVAKAASIVVLLFFSSPTTTAWSASQSMGMSKGLSPKAHTLRSCTSLRCDTTAALTPGVTKYPSENLPPPITLTLSDRPWCSRDFGPKSPDAASHDNHADVFLLFDAAQKRDEFRIQRDESRRIVATKFEHVIITFFFQEKSSLVECLV